MGRAYSTHGRDKKCLQNFGQKTWREETTRTEYVSVDAKIKLEWILGK
jgi:hypothetical protein